jgi:DNA replicative helicase MCM subunit Mcm2 (Cdc46/Mcm family)
MTRKRKADVDMISSERSQKEKDDIRTVMKIINDLERSELVIPTSKVLEGAKSKGIDEAETRLIIDTLMRTGNIYFPDKDSVSVVPKN